MLKYIYFSIIALCLSLLACGGFFDNADDSPPPVRDRSSSSSEALSSSSNGSSSSHNSENFFGIQWQRAPDQSHVHGPVPVTLDRFWISKNLITQGQYRAVLGTNPAKVVRNDTLPIEGASWNNAVNFGRTLSILMGLNQNAIRLPTEAEWEYAAYPGFIVTNSAYWEWTNDCFHNIFPYQTNNPSGPPNCPPAAERVRKGSSHNTFSTIERRFPTDPRLEFILDASDYISFRVVISEIDYFSITEQEEDE